MHISHSKACLVKQLLLYNGGQAYSIFVIHPSGSQVTIKVQLEREDEDIAPDVIAPFFPLVCVNVRILCSYVMCVVYAVYDE